MLSYIARRHAALIVPGILVGSAAAGCSREPEPPSRLETASTPAESAVPAPAKTDTLIPTTPNESAPTLPAPAVKPVRTRAAAAPSRATSGRSAGDSSPPAAPVADSATSPSQPVAPASAGPDTQYLKYDAATNTVTFELIGGPHGFQFNGYASGGATLTLPPKANVVMNFINKDGTPHSAQVISGEGPLPSGAVETAIPRAYTRQLIQGLAQEATDVMRFQVPESGSYRIFCGVPGHGLGGMWIWMKVDPAAKAPSFGPTKA
jgi:hypothetical protein